MQVFSYTKKEFKYFLSLYKSVGGSIKKNVSFPTTIEIQTINRCNAKCPMCPYSETTAKESFQKMDGELYERIIKEISKEKDFQTLVLTFQNEPLLDKDLISKARKFKEIMPHKKLEIVTNGSLLTKDIIQEIFDNFDTITISVNAYNEKTYKDVMQGLNWKTLKENLDNIATKKEWVDKTILRFIKQNSNHDEFKSFKRYWNRKGFAVFGFPVNSRLGSVKNFESIKFKNTMRMKIIKILSHFFTKTCPVPFMSFYIRVNGDVVLCFNDWTSNNLFGNVRSNSIREIFNSEKYTHVREKALENNILETEVCRNCDLYKEGLWLEHIL